MLHYKTQWQFENRGGWFFSHYKQYLRDLTSKEKAFIWAHGCESFRRAWCLWQSSTLLGIYCGPKLFILWPEMEREQGKGRAGTQKSPSRVCIQHSNSLLWGPKFYQLPEHQTCTAWTLGDTKDLNHKQKHETTCLSSHHIIVAT